MDDYFYWISFSFNALSFIPYILILIAYYKRRDSFNQTMKINIHFCIICFLLNTSYLLKNNKNGWCELQGSLYVTSYVIAFLFNLLISFLFFMKTIFIVYRKSIISFPLSTSQSRGLLQHNDACNTAPRWSSPPRRGCCSNG